MRWMRWMSDESEAARHPWKVTTTMFLIGWLFFAPFSYFRWDNRSVVVSAIVGCGFGLLLASLSIGWIGQLRGWPAWISGRQGQLPRAPIALDVLWVGAGLGIVIWGAARGSFELALVGAPLIALGAFWRLIKNSMRR